MTGLTLHLDTERWRTHLRTVAGAAPGLVPVAKGNGYGFGLPRLAAEAQWLGVDTLAVGMPSEVPAVRDAFEGSIVTLMPYEPGAETDSRVITTVTRVPDLIAVADRGVRVLVEVRTSMLRHGIAPEELPQVLGLLDRVGFEGWTIHLPLTSAGRYAEALRLARAALAVRPAPLWFSHLSVEEATSLARELGNPVRLRSGTRLWLDDAGSRRVTATVLDVHPIGAGQRAGYRQRRVPIDGWIVVVSGGTAQGVGLEAPSPATSVRQRAVAAVTGSLEAANLALSPYTIGDRKRWFLEPPHMQSCLLFLPRKVVPPRVGDEVPVEVRLTTAIVDRVVEL